MKIKKKKNVKIDNNNENNPKTEETKYFIYYFSNIVNIYDRTGKTVKQIKNNFKKTTKLILQNLCFPYKTPKTNIPESIIKKKSNHLKSHKQTNKN